MPAMPQPGAARLEEAAVDAELHVLQPGEHATSVVDPHQRLHAADCGSSAKWRGDARRRVGVEAAVGVDDHDDHLLASPPAQCSASSPSSRPPGVVRAPLPCPARVGRRCGAGPTRPGSVDRREDLARRSSEPSSITRITLCRRATIARAVDAVGDRHLLVQRRHEEDPQEVVGAIAVRQWGSVVSAQPATRTNSAPSTQASPTISSMSATQKRTCDGAGQPSNGTPARVAPRRLGAGSARGSMLAALDPHRAGGSTSSSKPAASSTAAREIARPERSGSGVVPGEQMLERGDDPLGRVSVAVGVLGAGHLGR